MLVYKILTYSEWEEANNSNHFDGSVLDQMDGFIHLSTQEQVANTLAIHFKGQDKLILLSFKAEYLENLKWEKSRDGLLFPHLYDKLPMQEYQNYWLLTVNEEGIPLSPWTETK